MGGLFSQFSFVFIFLLVWAIVYGVLAYVNPLKDERRGLYAIISVVLAILVSASASAVTFIRTMTVWFFVFGLFAFLILFVIGIFGLKEKDYISLIKNKDVNTWVIIVAIVIVLAALGSSFGQRLLEAGKWQGDQVVEPDQPDVVTAEEYTSGEGGTGASQKSTFSENMLQTMVNPKVLGLILIFMISLFAVIFLSKPSIP